MASFADVQYCIYAVGGSEKVQNYADVIYEWSLANLKLNWSLSLQKRKKSIVSSFEYFAVGTLLKDFFLILSLL